MIKFQNNDVILIQRSISNNEKEINDFPDSLLHFFTNVLLFLTRKQKNKNELLNIVLFLGDNDRV